MRLDDWNKRFWAHIAMARRKEFAWGSHDCVMFATSCIDAILGTDYYAQAQKRYPYSTEEEARALIAQHGGITGLVDSFLGEPVNWGQLGIGDVVLVNKMPLLMTDDIEMLCVHDGQALLGPLIDVRNRQSGAATIGKIPFSHALHGWRIN
jgi:hypothetical protein